MILTQTIFVFKVQQEFKIDVISMFWKPPLITIRARCINGHACQALVALPLVINQFLTPIPEFVQSDFGQLWRQFHWRVGADVLVPTNSWRNILRKFEAEINQIDWKNVFEFKIVICHQILCFQGSQLLKTLSMSDTITGGNNPHLQAVQGWSKMFRFHKFGDFENQNRCNRLKILILIRFRTWFRRRWCVTSSWLHRSWS